MLTCRSGTSPAGPVDLHRVDVPHQHARRGLLRLGDLPTALGCRRTHLPPALLPPQLHVRVHGSHPVRPSSSSFIVILLLPSSSPRLALSPAGSCAQRCVRGQEGGIP